MRCTHQHDPPSGGASRAQLLSALVRRLLHYDVSSRRCTSAQQTQQCLTTFVLSTCLLGQPRDEIAAVSCTPGLTSSKVPKSWLCPRMQSRLRFCSFALLQCFVMILVSCSLLCVKDVEDIVQNGYMGVLEIISHLQNLATANCSACQLKVVTHHWFAFC